MAVPHVLDLFSLKGKTAVLTGATGGIGVQISLALAEAGADIISLELPNDRLAPELRRIIEPTGRSLKSFECNIRNSQSIKDCFAEMWRAGVVPDILVNLAGITNHNSVEGTRVEDLDAVSLLKSHTHFVPQGEFLTVATGYGNQFSGYLLGGPRIRQRTTSVEAAWQDYQLLLDGGLACSDQHTRVQQQ